MRRPYTTEGCEEPPNLVIRNVWCEGGPVAHLSHITRHTRLLAVSRRFGA